jgi:hypothetical protein
MEDGRKKFELKHIRFFSEISIGTALPISATRMRGRKQFDVALRGSVFESLRNSESRAQKLCKGRFKRFAALAAMTVIRN